MVSFVVKAESGTYLCRDIRILCALSRRSGYNHQHSEREMEDRRRTNNSKPQKEVIPVKPPFPNLPTGVETKGDDA